MSSFRQSCASLFLGSSVAGFLVGALFYPNWQGVIEPAQALTGIVRYPAWNPHYRYEVGTWTLLNQLSAAALRIGISERTLAVIVSGLGGAIWFAVIALVVHAICRRPLVAFLSPFVFVAVRGVVIPGVTYPIMILGAEFTYGTVGLAFAILVLALFASNELRWGAFAAALAPAIHVSMAFWLFVTLLIAASMERRWARDVIAKWRFWASGMALTIVSLAVQRWLGLSRIDEPEHEIVASFLRHWDGHRQPFPLWSPATAEVVVGAILAVVLLAWARRDSDASGMRVVAIVAIAAAVVGFACSAVYWWPPEKVPRLLLALMPSRLMNIDVALATPLTLALLARRGDRALTATLFALLVNATVTDSLHRWLSGTWVDRVVPGWHAIHSTWVAVGIEGVVAVSLLLGLTRVRRRFAVIAASAFAMALALALQTSVRSEVLGRYSTARALAMLMLIAIAVIALVCAARWERLRGISVPLRFPHAATSVASAAAFVVFAVRAASADRPALMDRTNDPFWRIVAAHHGAIVTGAGVTNVQLRSRRPILIDLELLDYLPFTPGAGPGMDLILRDVYGIDLRKPPAGEKPARAMWERRTADEWHVIGEKFGATEVLVRTEWRLQLRKIAEGGGLALYDMKRVPRVVK